MGFSFHFSSLLNVIKYCQIKGWLKSVDIFLNCNYTFLELLCSQLDSIESGVSKNQHFKRKKEAQVRFWGRISIGVSR